MQLTPYLKNCWFWGNSTDIEPNTSFILKNILYYIILGTLVKSNISDPVEASIEMVMRILVTLIFISSTLYLANKLSLFLNLLSAVIICEIFFMTLTGGNELLTSFSLFPEWEVVTNYWGWIQLTWHVMVLIYILKQALSIDFFVTLLFAASYYGMMSYGAAFFTEVLF